MKKQDQPKQDTTTQTEGVDTVQPETDTDVEKLTREVEEWKGKYMRALADYQNLERRNREDKDRIYAYASELVLGRMIPAIDTLLKAKNHLQDVGLDLAYKEFTAILDEKGVVRIKTVGEQFDPHVMECIEVVDGEDNVVIEEILPGYLLGENVLRVAHVKVGKKQ